MREDNDRRGSNKENWCSNELIKPRKLDQPRHLSISDCNHKHAKFDMEKELTAFIKQNSLCDCEDCNTKKHKNKYKELMKLIKEHNLSDCEECNTKEKDTREIERHNKDDKGAILSGTLYRNSTHISEVSTGNTEQDSNTGEWYEEDSDSVISAETMYNEGIHTSGENKNNTWPNNGTLLHDPFNYSAGISTSDATYSISMSNKGTYDSD